MAQIPVTWLVKRNTYDVPEYSIDLVITNQNATILVTDLVITNQNATILVG
jgi:Ni,Fe-hydrogenase III small subunit